MTDLATGIVLTAGTITFGNEWYQTGKVNFKVAVATLLAAAVFDGLSHIDDKAAVGLSVMVLLGAFTAKFGGKSVAETLAQVFTSVDKGSKKQPARKAA
jgi:hypothetical protein